MHGIAKPFAVDHGLLPIFKPLIAFPAGKTCNVYGCRQYYQWENAANMNIDKPAAAAIIVLSCCFANGQSFEVASIHRNLRGSQDTSVDILPGGKISATSTTLKTLIRYAYKIQSFQLAGEKGWIDSEYYDIEAKTGGGRDSLRGALEALPAESAGGPFSS